VAECVSEKERLIMKLLLMCAQEQEPDFIWGDGDSNPQNHFMVCMDNNHYLGYIRWSLDEKENVPIIRQWFIVKEQQRQGIGTMFLRH